MTAKIEKPLTTKQEAFCIYRVRPDCVSDVQAYRAAYNSTNMSDATAHSRVGELMKHSGIAARLAKNRELGAQRAVMSVGDVLNDWITLHRADPSELVKTRQNACRHCWGFEHLYQWRHVREYRQECDAIERANVNLRKKGSNEEKALPDLGGGFGFRRLRGPHPECPECEGHGEVEVIMPDLDTVSASARMLYAGLKMTQRGPEVKLRDQDGALKNVATYLGMLTQKVSLDVPNPIGIAAIVATMTEQEAADVYLRTMRGS